MSFLDNLRRKVVLRRKGEEFIYALVADEMNKGVINQALWLKALELTHGDKDKQAAKYINLRVRSLRDEIEIVDRSHSRGSAIQEQAGSRAIEEGEYVENLVSLILQGHPVEDVVRFFSGVGKDAVRAIVNQEDSTGDCPLHLAIKKSRADIAEWLLQAGANPSAINRWESTPLDIAVRRGDPALQRLLKRYSP